MAEMKNLCGKIPVELHIKVRQEIEEREISTQQFIQQVIEEHFTEKGGQVSMAVRTLAVQVSEELFARFKAAVAKKGCKQKDFLIGIIEKAIEEIENEMKPDEAEAEETEVEVEAVNETGTEEAEAEVAQVGTEAGDGQENREQPVEAENNAAEPESVLTESEELESGDTKEAGPEESETEEAEDLELDTDEEAETKEIA